MSEEKEFEITEPTEEEKKWAANSILNRVKDGDNVPLTLINWALTVTGDAKG